MPVPEIAGSQNYSKFVSLPNPLENREGEIKQGEIVKITSIFTAPDNPKLKSFLLGEIELSNGEKRALGLNMTSYFEIAKSYGENTDDWLNKTIVYCGFKKLKKGNGHLWVAEGWDV